MSIETMTKLATATVGVGGSSSIEFTNIPQTYTELKILLSIKDVSTGTSGATYIDIRLNGSTGTYNVKRLVGYGSSTTTNTGQTSGFMSIGYFGNSRTSMANMFTNAELNFPNYTSSNNKTVSCYFAMPDNTTTGPYSGSGSGIWENTSPINSILIRADGVNLAQHSTATLYGIQNARRAAGNSVKAIGGNISFDGTYVYHTFNSSGTFTPTSPLTADYLVVAAGGGGGGSSGSTSGAGGAGGYRTTVGTSGGGASAESKLYLSATTPYSVIIGAGGSAGTASNNVNGSNGSDSSFWNITSLGGGGGGAGGAGATRNGLSGGSGGGAGNQGTQGLGGAGTANQGYAGGNEAPGNRGGGGGGAGAAGSNSTTTIGGAGGIGILSPITNTYFAGGGGGGSAGGYGPALGGLGGGGQGGGFPDVYSTAGRPNTGGGGGGGERNGSSAGGSGIVIIRYKG